MKTFGSLTTAQKLRIGAYAACMLVGGAATWYWMIATLGHDGGPELLYSPAWFSAFNEQSYANPAAAAMSTDVSFAFFTFAIFGISEARRLRAPSIYVLVALTLPLGLVIGFPLLLILRELLDSPRPAAGIQSTQIDSRRERAA